MGELLFFLGLSFILAHELDAIQRREWRIFPLLSRLDDTTGFAVFTVIHVPLLFLLLWELFANDVNTSLANGMNIFFIVHIGLHLLALRHPQNEFTSVLSWSLILGAGLCGALALLFGL